MTTEPPVSYDSKTVYVDLRRMQRLPPPPCDDERVQLRFEQGFRNYQWALYPILRETHTGLKGMPKFRAVSCCWRELSEDERQAWARPAA
tara:strand:- start:108 stop:377 length:270 start_codon:yes stop_codon:yes gene_type:complete